VRTLVQRPLVRIGTLQLQRREQLRPQLAVSRRFVARCDRPRKFRRPATAQLKTGTTPHGTGGREKAGLHVQASG
jgi:hypothetical protein